MGRIEVGARALAAAVGDRVDAPERVDALFMLDPGWIVGEREAASDGDEATGQEVELGLPVFTIHRQGIVATDATPRSDGQGIAQARFVKKSALRVVDASEDVERG